MNPEQLTHVFKENGYLGDAVVEQARLTTLDTNGLSSDMFHLELKYSSDDHSLPRRMFVKRPRLTDRGKGEAVVYDQILRGETNLQVLTCFGIVDDDPATGLNFLFEDLSDSHGQTQWPIIPSRSQCEGAVTALAGVHANWWGRTGDIPHLVAPVAAQHKASHLERFFPDFIDFVGESLSRKRVGEYERVFSNLDRLLKDRLSEANATLLHTDSHFWNYLYANNGDTENCVMFDWALWNRGLAGSDLAYMIALHLYPEHRRRFEGPLLDNYWEVLTKRGVKYDRVDVQLDYRVGIIIGLLMPVLEFSWNIIPYDWIPKLEKAFAAFDDLDCAELLDQV